MEEKEGIKFYYNRNERLRKLREVTGERRRRFRFLAKGRTRGLLIILVDLLLISGVMYMLNKPANVYMQKTEDGVIYELNVTSIKGKRILIGFSVKNQGQDNLVFSESVPVVVKIEGRNGEVLVLQDIIEENTVLFPDESTSIVFLLGHDELPGSGRVDVYYESSSGPIFSRSVRF